MRRRVSPQRHPDIEDAPPVEPRADHEAEEKCDDVVAWQQWLFGAAMGSSPTPVHLPRCLVNRMWARTTADHIPATREP